MKNREIELKYELTDSYSYTRLVRLTERFIRQFIPQPYGVFEGTATDKFWVLPGTKSDFVRLRSNADGHGEITVKYTDKGLVSNRVEINVPTTSLDKGESFMQQLFGPHALQLRKNFTIFSFMGSVEVSVYAVGNRVFLEIEAPTMKQVKDFRDALTFLREYEPETRSLFQIFTGVKKLPVRLVA